MAIRDFHTGGGGLGAELRMMSLSDGIRCRKYFKQEVEGCRNMQKGLVCSDDNSVS